MGRWGILLIMAALVAGCSWEERQQPVRKRMSVVETMVIGAHGDPSRNGPLLSFIRDAVTDSSGNIFMVDGGTMKIHAYGPDGSYRWSRGGEGPGPGEYNRISDIFVDADQRLGVYDWERKMVTFYTADGRRTGSRSIGTAGSVEHIRPAPGGGYIIPSWDRNRLIQLYAPGFDSLQDSLVGMDEARQTDNEREEEMIRSLPGSAMFMPDGRIAYVPYHYDGRIDLYRRTDSTGWLQDGVMRGYRQRTEAVTIRISDSPDDDHSHMISWQADGAYAHFEFSAVSFGLYPQVDGQLVHLSYGAAESGMQLVVEHFDPERQQLVSYAMINSFDIGQQYHIRPVWMDERGNIFLADNREVPQLRRVHLVAAE